MRTRFLYMNNPGTMGSRQHVSRIQNASFQPRRPIPRDPRTEVLKKSPADAIDFLTESTAAAGLLLPASEAVSTGST